MNILIVADEAGEELRDMVFTAYDFEVGEEDNSFQIDIKRQEYDYIPKNGRIYIPDTEYGGLFRRMETDTEQNAIRPGGMTWRGMMRKKIIMPPAGADYATDSGELNTIIANRLETALPGLFLGSAFDTGVTVSNFKYDRYCTLEEGLTKLLKSVGYRLDIRYSQPDKAVIVQAVPIADYSHQVEFSSDMQLNYLMRMQGDGINHLICLGQGELRDRTVYHLYVDQNGNISTTQYYKGIYEVAEVYDYAGAELEDLKVSGREHLLELMDQNLFEIKVESGTMIEIGDIVGGRDYLSGMRMTSPIVGKVVRWENGFQNTEYKLGNDVTIELEDA